MSAQAEDTADRVGLESISAALLNKVTHYHAQIGHNVDKTKLYELEYKLLQDAKHLYHNHHWEDALNTFAQVVPVRVRAALLCGQQLRSAPAQKAQRGPRLAPPRPPEHVVMIAAAGAGDCGEDAHEPGPRDPRRHHPQHRL
eukprot:1989878-Prymnesium_polylepis.1